MPARVHGYDVRLALAERTGGAGPAAQFDVAGIVELGLVEADQRFELSGRELGKQRVVPIELRIGVAVGAWEMRHAAARQHRGTQIQRADTAGHCLAEGIAALRRRLRRQIGIDEDRQYGVGEAEMGQRNADGVIDFRRGGERRIEILPIEFAHQLEPDLARHLPVKFSAGEFAARLTAHMDGEGRRDVVKELLTMIIREDDPQIGLHRLQPVADLARDAADLLDIRLVLGLRHGEELRRMGQHGPANDRRSHA